jgi:hypothetical protein
VGFLVNGLAKKAEKDMVIDSVSGLLVGRLSGNVVKDNAGNVLSNILVKSTGEIIDTTGKKILSRGIGNGVTATLFTKSSLIEKFGAEFVELTANKKITYEAIVDGAAFVKNGKPYWVELGKESVYDSTGKKIVSGSGWLHIISEIRPDSGFTRLVELQRMGVVSEASEVELRKLISTTISNFNR